VRLILALGNPGERYRDTRHNVGWWLADRIARAWRCGAFLGDRHSAWAACTRGGHATEIHKPLTFMNRSGRVVRALLDDHGFDPATDLLVLVDDVALPPGRIRLRQRGSAGGHNGLASISQVLDGEEYCRLRIGVGRPPDGRVDLADWVLAPLSRVEEEAVLGAFPRAVEAVEAWLEDGIEVAMSRFNSSDGCDSMSFNLNA